MKNAIPFIFLFLGVINAIQAQNQPEKKDTMAIILNGEKLVIPVPKSGNKTTISFEDSSSLIQLSISKTARITDPIKSLKRDSTILRKSVSWFNEIESGGLFLTNKRDFTILQDSNNYLRGSLGDYRQQILINIKKVNPGFSLGFSVKEKSRKIDRFDIKFVTGTRFRFERYTSSGICQFYERKTANDSFVKTSEVEIKLNTNLYQFIFPFMFEKQFNKISNFKFYAGVNLIANFQSITYSGIGSRVTSFIYSNPQTVIVQPNIKIYKNKTAIYAGINVSKTVVGNSLSNKIYGNMFHFGLIRKLY